MEYNYEKERREAQEAGKRALSSLKKAAEELNSAKNWGIADLIGGGVFITMAKRSKMNHAQEYMDQARADLKVFARELDDLHMQENLNVQTGDFLTFADYFFDGVIADWLVQDKINQARTSVDDAVRRVEGILSQLNH